MKGTVWDEVIGELDDELVEEALSTCAQGAADPAEPAPMNGKDLILMNNKQQRTPRISRTLRIGLIAAVLVLLLTGSVLAVGALINSPEQAWKVAQAQLGQWKELGLLVPEVTLDEEAQRIMELPEQTGDNYWFGRIWKHRYNISAYQTGGKYYFNMDVDTASGKITRLSIEADADETDKMVRSETTLDGQVWDFYENYEDIFAPDMTVDRFCTLLAEYWGFSGYTLGDTEDSFYAYDAPAPSGDMLLRELSQGAYLTVYFEGDQSGVPMYVELSQFPGRVAMLVGTNHAVG